MLLEKSFFLQITQKKEKLLFRHFRNKFVQINRCNVSRLIYKTAEKYVTFVREYDSERK